ncbi:hypothetical protein SETIT_8G033800v2 [Setaria italica]|uniref:Uncharacterized protein n=1 Tax=Setaria italica TaxID=4555 RepID=A0A368S411_SETIT|nr:hypothetical protein SETIT_8G033800v2 [Setaria italica]
MQGKLKEDLRTDRFTMCKQQAFRSRKNYKLLPVESAP